MCAFKKEESDDGMGSWFPKRARPRRVDRDLDRSRRRRSFVRPGLRVAGSESEPHQSVLVCDSESESVRALKFILRGARLTVRTAATAEDALTSAALRMPDAVLLEMELFSSSGLEVCRRLRDQSTMPIIFVSGVSEADRVIQAFQAGADDYILKPFRPGELVARVHAHLRRVKVDDDEPLMLADGVVVDLAARAVCRDGQHKSLTPIEYRLLCALIKNRGRLLTHEALLREVWGLAYSPYRPALRVHMGNLRRKLGLPSSGGAIRTYPGVGYLLEQPPGEASSSPAAAGTRLPSLRRVRTA